MSQNNIEFEFPFVGKGKAQGLIGVIALLVLVSVLMFAVLHWPWVVVLAFTPRLPVLAHKPETECRTKGKQ